MGIIDSATQAVSTAASSVSSFVDSGPASALSGVVNSVTGAIGSVGSLLKSLGGTKLPLPNVLHNYSTYNYVLSLGVLSADDLNNPDSSYMAGKPVPLICKSAGADPSNRIATAYGKFDFYMDNLSFQCNMGFEKANNTNVTLLKFEITEPLSMGMFLVACQTAAYQNGWRNYKDAPYLLKVEFRGNTASAISSIPKTTRYIPIKITQLDMTVTERGAVYKVAGVAYNHTAHSTRTANLTAETSIKGATVQEVLQTGPKSLQAVLNKRLQEYKKDGTVEEPDEIIILFPTDPASSVAPVASSGESKGGATTTAGSSSSSSGSGSLEEKLGISKSKINETLVQPDGQCNALGKASMGYGLDKLGDPSFGSEVKVWDAKNRVWTRGNNTSNIKEGELRFSQGSDIINSINQVLLRSNFPTETLDASKVTPEGLRGWWTIDTQVFVKPFPENKKTGTKPRMIVYRVLPYNVSVASTMPPNTAPPGVSNLQKQAVKEYNYIYTGKNLDILKFDIKFNVSFQATLAADNYKKSQNVQMAANNNQAKEPQSDIIPQQDGAAPVPKAGVTPTSANYALTTTPSDRLGGDSNETEATRAARIFHNAITKGKDMMQLNMDIMGDPYYIAQSGTGNYTSKSTPYQNLNADGTVNYQNGEVHIVVNFRTPVDINQTTGMYNFAGSKTAPVLAFSGLYRVSKVMSIFSNGQFKQTVIGNRLPQQENPTVGTADKTFSVSNKTAPKPE